MTKSHASGRLGAVLLAATIGVLAGSCSSSAPKGIGTGGATGTGGTQDDAGATGGATATGGSAGGNVDAGSGFDVPMGVDITIIQEDQLGFAAVDGKIYPRQGSTSITGYTGTGFADGDPGFGKTISYSVKAEAAGTFALSWRYAFGGDQANTRDARLLVNGVVVAELVAFPYTGSWTDWQVLAPVQVPLAAGPNFIQLQSLGAGGLANFDYLEIDGPGIAPDAPSFTLTVGQNDPAGGTVSVEPVLPFYPTGTMVTLTATAAAGFFLQSWMGDVPSAQAMFTFAIDRNTVATARFLPDGATQDPAALGYATVQDDAGTPFLLNGGAQGPSVTATTLDELKTYLAGDEPRVVSFGGLIAGADSIPVGSNKTLLGEGATAHLMGIELELNGSRNVIIRNVAVSHVIADGSGIANDAIEITGGAKNIWIDHCELFSDLDNGKDFYDGLLDIKNASSFITVSWTEVHHHWKASLISSGDEQVGDTVIRATYHHNYFHDCGSRLPSIRFGKAHVFNNYYFNNTSGSCVNSRMGAVVKVENNVFQMSKDAIGSWDSAMVGTWDVAGNVFDQCTGSLPTTSTGMLTPPYVYTPDATTDLATAIPAGAGVGKL